jgi:hypothetical protein
MHLSASIALADLSSLLPNCLPVVRFFSKRADHELVNINLYRYNIAQSGISANQRNDTLAASGYRLARYNAGIEQLSASLSHLPEIMPSLRPAFPMKAKGL